MSAKFLLNNSNDEVFRELFIATKLLPADEVLIDGKRHVLHNAHVIIVLICRLLVRTTQGLSCPRALICDAKLYLFPFQFVRLGHRYSHQMCGDQQHH